MMESAEQKRYYYDPDNDAERVFIDDSRDKKRTGNGVHGRAARLRKKEAVVMPYERMDKTSIEYKLAVKPGVVHHTTIGEIKMNELMQRVHAGEIPAMHEIDALPFKEAQQVVAELRRLHTNKDFMRAWNTYVGKVVDFVYKKYQVTTGTGGSVLMGDAATAYADAKVSGLRKPRKQQDEDEEIPRQKRPYNKKSQQIIPLVPQEEEQVQQLAPVVIAQAPKKDGLEINIARKYNSKEFAKLLERLALFTDTEEEQELFVGITIREIM